MMILTIWWSKATRLLEFSRFASLDLRTWIFCDEDEELRILLDLLTSDSNWWYPFQPCPDECPPLPPTPGHLCVTPAGAQDCHYDDSNGGTEQSPFVSKCCCGQCETDPITCAPDSTTGSGLWQPMHSPLCPVGGCGSEGEWWKIILSSSWKPQVSSPHQTTLTSILTTSTRLRQ